MTFPVSASLITVPSRHPEYDIIGIGPVAASLPPGLAVLCRIFPLVPEVLERVQSLVHLEDHVSSSSTVPAVRASVRNIQLPAEADMPVPAFSGTDKYFRSVCKHVLPLLSDLGFKCKKALPFLVYGRVQPLLLTVLRDR